MIAHGRHHKRTIVASLCALIALLLSAPQLALAATGDLQLVRISGVGVSESASSGPVIYVRDGDTAEVTLTLRNTSGHDLESVSMVDAPAYKASDHGLESIGFGKDEDAFEPIAFPPYGNGEGQVSGATNTGGEQVFTSETAFYRKPGYLIEAGATATFKVRVSAGDLATGTYNWSIQLGRKRYDYEWRIVVVDPTLSYYDVFSCGEELEELYSGKIPLKVVIYNQEGAGLTVGTGSSIDLTPLPMAGIDFGAINLATAGEGELGGSRTVTVVNAAAANSPKADAHGNSTSIQVGFGGENAIGGVAVWDGAFTFGNGTLYDTNWAPLAPRTTSGGSTSVDYADYTVSFDATKLIAGTYTGNLIVSTVPHKVSVNGVAGNDTGTYRFPLTLRLTGINPRLLPRATNLTATAGNGLVELTWTTPDRAGEYAEYAIWRREGSEGQGDPDKLSWAPYEKVGTAVRGTSNEMLYVDGDVENGKTYSYTVICGEPHRGYAAKVASASPSASIQGRMLAPVSSTYGQLNTVEVSWRMNDKYGGGESDGAGMVDHFNVYRDGVLVDQIYQSAVVDEVTYGWHDDGTGTGTQVYGPISHSYSWVVNEPVPAPYTPYRWTVSAVSPSGVEGYLDEEGTEEAYGDRPVILGHTAWFDDQYYVYANLKEFDDVPAIAMRIDNRVGNYGSAEELAIWKSAGTAVPDTAQAPYVTVSGSYADEYGGDVQFADKNVRAGQTYTYTVRATGEDGEVSEPYTFTVKAVTPTPDDYFYFTSPHVTWSVVDGTTARLEFSPYKHITATVYRNGAKLNCTPEDGYDVWYYDVQDNPGKDGTYTYRVDYTYAGITMRGRDFTFVRTTKPVDTSSLLEPPDAPTLSGRTSGDYNVILSWKPAATGGTPEGYHIYRKDGQEQKLGGRQVTHQRWSGPYDVFESWGNGRYLTIQDAGTLTFVDGRVNDRPNNDCYKNDPHLGRIEGLSWGNDELPHEYYVTAYNRAGESAPSRLLVFDGYDTDEWGNRVAPANPVSEVPGAPDITRMWMDWEDGSSWQYGFDSAIGGRLRVAWDDPILSGDIDSWGLTYRGTHWEDPELGNPPLTDSLAYYRAVADPTSTQGTSPDAPGCYLFADAGKDGELGRTLSVTVAATNGMGSATSPATPFYVASFPRFRALPDDGGAQLEWTDLFNDTRTRVTGWEVWRKAEHGIWERVTQLPASLAYAGTDPDHNGSVRYYAWHDDDADNGWAYQYQVVAKCADGIDRASVVREVTPERTAAIEAPGAPRNLRASVEKGVVYLSWDAPTAGGAVGEYLPQVRGADCDWYFGTIGSVTGDSTSTAWVPSKPGTYKIMVWARNFIDGVDVPDSRLPYELEGYGSYDEAIAAYDAMTDEQQLAALYTNYSNVVTVTVTQADISSQPSGSAGAFSLTLTPGDGQVSVSWTRSENAVAYEIERYDAPGNRMPTVKVAAMPGQRSFTYVDATAEPGVRYRYVVTARSASGNGLYRDGYARATGTTRDQQAAAQVAALVDALPASGAVTIDDAARIAEVQEAYDALTERQRAYVGDARATKLAAVAAAIKELELLSRYSELVAPIQALIDALPEATAVTIADEAQVTAARAAYDALTPAEAKRLVSTARLAAAEEALAALRQAELDAIVAEGVVAQIEALVDPAEATEADRAAVDEVRAAYDALTNDQKALVGNAGRLIAIEKAVASDERDSADAAAVTTRIEALPDAPRLTLADRAKVEAASAALAQLGERAASRVSDAAKARLAAAEERIATLVGDAAVPHSVAYRTHVQSYGWQAPVSDGAMSGTSGEGKRLEAIEIALADAPYEGGIRYRTHVQTYGWQAPVSDGAMSGTSGEGKRLEAIEIALTGEMADHYDVYYRVHAQHFGWMGWARNGAQAGTAGYGYRLEAIEIALVAKGAPTPDGKTTSGAFRDKAGPVSGVPDAEAGVLYQTHVQSYGWQSWQRDGEMAGTSGEGKRLEAICIRLGNRPYAGGITYRTHVQSYGWRQGWVGDGALSGTSGEGKRLEAIEIALTGEMADRYDVYYRVHAQHFGWMGWAKNGESAGTAGYSYRLEAIEVRLVDKGGVAPGSTAGAYRQK